MDHKLAAEHARTFRSKRDALLGLANSLADEVSDIVNDRYLPKHEKERQLAEARDRVDRQIADAVAEAEDAHAGAVSFATDALDELDIPEASRGRVARLLDSNVGAEDVLERARARGDVDTLAALRDELAWRASDGRLVAESQGLSRSVDHAIAEALRGRGGEELSALLDMTDDSGGIPEARRIAVNEVEGKKAQAVQARLSLAYKTNSGAPALGHGRAESGEGEGEGEGE